MKNRTLTWEDYEQHEPCYSPAEKYGQWEGTILDLLQHPSIPDRDKIWAFTREGIVDDKTLRLFAVNCAKEVQHLMNDKRSIAALDVAERYANGMATSEELASARAAASEAARAADAAWVAASAAARHAARDADAAPAAAALAAAGAWAAARDAARASDAARDAARDAAGAAAGAWAAARDAAWAAAGDADAARKKQVQIAIELLQ